MLNIVILSVIGDVYTWGWGKHGQLGHQGPHNACAGVTYGPGDDGSEPDPRCLLLQQHEEETLVHHLAVIAAKLGPDFQSAGLNGSQFHLIQ